MTYSDMWVLDSSEEWMVLLNLKILGRDKHFQVQEWIINLIEIDKTCEFSAVRSLEDTLRAKLNVPIFENISYLLILVSCLDICHFNICFFYVFSTFENKVVIYFM